MAKTRLGMHIFHLFRRTVGSPAISCVNSRIKRLVFSTLVMMLALNACTSARVVHYPESFNWKGDKEVTTIMQSMGQSVLKLDELAGKDGVSQPDPDRQLKTLAELEKIEYQARLMTSEGADGHPWFEENLEYFVSTVLLAKRQSQSNPPDYYTTGQLTAACNFCHKNFRVR